MAIDHAPSFLAGGGEMGARMRAVDWASTPLGAVDSWPQSLRSAVSILLPSKAQIILFWGRDLVALYNDAYRPVFGTKHPWALGRPAQECWSEVWNVLGPLFGGVLSTGEAFWAQDHLFYLDRLGFLEETYFDVSYDPVRVEDGTVGGIFCIVSETTGRVLGERRLRTLRELGTRTADVRGAADVWAVAADVLATNPGDLPFSLLYRAAAPGLRAELVGRSGVAEDAIVFPADVTSDKLEALTAVLEEGRVMAVATESFVRRLPASAAEDALVLPVMAGRQVVGFLVAGVSRFLKLDGVYRDFLDLLVGRLSAAIANARALEDERRRAEALSELDRAKTAFFSNVSHEFRTPLTLLLGPLEDALAAASGGPDRERLELVHRNALRLLKLVNALLDFSRIEAGRVEAVYEPTDLAAATAELTALFRSAIERAGLHLVVRCAPLPRPVFVDREMWEKIVLNLLSNALKFTFEGTIAVTVRPHGDHAVLEVGDTGIGIPIAEQPFVFDRFHQVRDARSRTHEGTGIGLALVQDLVRLHGGTVSVESEPGRGSLFTVAIPFGAEHLPAERVGSQRRRASTAVRAEAYVDEALRWLADDLASDDATEAPAIATTGARVLVADDNADMREYLRSLLGAHWTVECVGDGVSALAAARARPPALVLTDVMMPGLDGFDLLRELRADERTRTTPVILVSARAGDESRAEGLDAGADDYLVKPFSARELLARVNAHLKLAETRRQALAREQEARRVADRLSEELGHLLERERASRAEAEAANRAKDEFLAILSHELRTPLNAVLGWARILKTTPENGALLHRAVDTIARNAELQAQLIDDLLDVSRIVAGKLSLEISAVDLRRVVEDAVQSVSAAAAAKGVRIEIESGGVSGFVAGDSRRLQQVVWNLLSNAVKFTPTGALVRVAVRPDADWIEIAVSDSGAGIDPSFLPHVFERFRQADSTTTRGQGGLGLGLAIVRHIVEQHGGEVQATSEGLGRGATFTVRLPRRKPTETTADSGEAHTPLPAMPAPGPLLSGLRILVVDDEPDSRDVVATALGEYGAVVTAVDSAREALRQLGASSPHVLVSDISMPGEDGYELIRRVRAQPDASRARVLAIALTAYARPEERLQSLMAGFDAHVAKPIDPAELATVIARLAGVTP